MRNPTSVMLAVFGVILTLFGSVYIVNESQTAIVLNLGKVVRSDIKPGLHFKVPFVEQVRKFDRRLLTLDDNPERYLTAEKKDVDIVLSDLKRRITPFDRGQAEARLAELLAMAP